MSLTAIAAAFLPTVIKAVTGNPLKNSAGAKGLLASKTIQGGLGLGAVPVFIFPLVDDLGLGQTASAAIKLVLMVAAFAWLVYGRATAGKKLGKA